MPPKRITIAAENMRKTLDGSTARYIQQRLPEINMVLGRNHHEYTLTFWRNDAHVDGEEADAIAEAFNVPAGSEPTIFVSKEVSGPAFAHRYTWVEEPAAAL